MREQKTTISKPGQLTIDPATDGVRHTHELAEEKEFCMDSPEGKALMVAVKLWRSFEPDAAITVLASFIGIPDKEIASALGLFGLTGERQKAANAYLSLFPHLKEKPCR